MVIAPYKRPPEPPTVALLTENGQAVDERGRRLDFDDWPAGTRAWCSFDTVRQLIADGRGEASCWQGEEIHWRHARLDKEGWIARPSDVHVIKLAFPEASEEALRALKRWRSWLARYQAAPLSTSGSAAWSLLRSTIDGTLHCTTPFNDSPPLRLTIGGRQELGRAGRGSFEGHLEQWDMPAAYAAALAQVVYGGAWRRSSRILPADESRSLEWWGAGGRCVFARAKVVIPELAHGPLPRRPSSPRDPRHRMGLGVEYPTGVTMQGFWTLEELQAAEDAGCRILRVLEVWAQLADGRRPFEAWWQAILEGREMHALAGQLAKMTGNALWGRLCMDGRYGRRTIRSSRGSRVVSRSLVMRGGQIPAHDLAETVSGRVRSELFRAMLAAGPDLLSAHTDGVWIREGEASKVLEARGWRLKTKAKRLDLLSPQNLRYWPRPYRRDSPYTVYSGVPSSMADAAFDEAWAKL